MSRESYEKLSCEKLDAYLDGRLDEKETAEIDALVDNDPELKLLVDDYIHTQLSIINDKKSSEGADAIVDLSAINSINSAINKVKKSDNEINVASAKESRKHLGWMIGVACSLILIIVGAMVISPLSYQVSEPAMTMSRGDFAVFGEEVDYEARLADTESAIDELEKQLPRFAFFDRYKSKEERERIMEMRSEVYELKWTRIDCLMMLKRDVELKKALEEYVEIEGYHQEEAMEILKRLRE